jgi:hypothetical protein
MYYSYIELFSLRLEILHFDSEILVVLVSVFMIKTYLYYYYY